MKKVTQFENRRASDAHKDKHDALLREIARLRKQLAKQEGTIHKLSRQALEDSLTGLANRRAFDKALNIALADYKRYNHGGAILLIDVNQFKSINDSLGHAAGDALLQHIASILELHTRSTDFIARIGGDEFCVILKEASGLDADLKAAELEASIAHTPCWYDSKEIYASVSIGTCSFRESAQLSKIMEKADEAMYASKREDSKYSNV